MIEEWRAARDEFRTPFALYDSQDEYLSVVFHSFNIETR
jgi:hypothetical protein